MTQVPASSHGGSIPSQSVMLSAAQILDIHNTPVTLVSAPVATSYIVPARVFYTYRFGTTPYTVTDTSGYIRFQGGTTNLFLLFLSILEGTVDQANYENEGQGAVFALTECLGKALQLRAGTSNPTAGDGTLELVTEYAIVTP